MSDVSIGVNNYKGKEVNTFEANTTPLETKTFGLINFDKTNDFSVPLQLKEKDGTDGPKIYLRPDQIDALRLSSMGGGRQQQLDEAMGEVSKAGVSATVNGKNYSIPFETIQSLHGTLMQ